MIIIFLINQSFKRLQSHDHHGFCYHVPIGHYQNYVFFCTVPSRQRYLIKTLPSWPRYLLKNLPPQLRYLQKFRPRYKLSFLLYCCFPDNTGALKCIIMTKHLVLTQFKAPFYSPKSLDITFWG